jgi:hypothetical protein
MSVEDVCYILSTLFHHAKQHFLRCRKRNGGGGGETLSKLDEKSETRYREMMNSAACRIRENPLRIIGGECHVATLILQTFYDETSTASKATRKILKPYLEAFFVETYKNCWFIDEWKNYVDGGDELRALRIFSRLVSEDRITCKVGLLDAFEKSEYPKLEKRSDI